MAEPQIAQAAGTGARTTVLALLTSVALAVVKIAAGLVGHTYALVADGIESVLDIFSAVAVLGGLRLSAAPQTPQYPYGLGKAEPLAALVVATMLVLAAVGIAVQAVREIVTPQAAPAPFTLFVLVGVVITKELLFRNLRSKGKQIGSRAMAADAWHHRSDALTSLAAFVGISTALVLGEGYESADDWAALLACGVIAFNGIRLFRSALAEILDVAAPREVEQRIRDIACSVLHVEGVDLCRVRRSGLGYFVDIHIEVAGEITVRRGHEIAHDVKDALFHSEVPVLDVLVHTEPHPPAAHPPAPAMPSLHP